MDDVAAAFDPQLMFDFPDPYPMFAEMRRTQPVAHFTMLGRENYVVTRYDDVWAVLRDGDTYSSRANYEVGKFFGRTIIEMDGKEHARTRALVSAVFSARAIEALQPVITRLVHERIDTFTGAGRADDEVISFLRLLLPAGAETTSRLMGSMFFALLAERGEPLERMRADRALVPWAVEETLRWETPVLFVARQATRPIEIAGVHIPERKFVSAVIASGNRDETHYPDPDRFDLDRRADDHLSFGFGRHFCLGYHLAKMEARTALGAVLDRLPGLRLDPDAQPPRITGLAFRSPQALRVRW